MKNRGRIDPGDVALAIKYIGKHPNARRYVIVGLLQSHNLTGFQARRAYDEAMRVLSGKSSGDYTY